MSDGLKRSLLLLGIIAIIGLTIAFGIWLARPEFPRKLRNGEVWPTADELMATPGLPRIYFPQGTVLYSVWGGPSKMGPGARDPFSLGSAIEALKDDESVSACFPGRSHQIAFENELQLDAVIVAVERALKEDSYLVLHPPLGTERLYFSADRALAVSIETDKKILISDQAMPNITVSVLSIYPPASQEELETFGAGPIEP